MADVMEMPRGLCCQCYKDAMSAFQFIQLSRKAAREWENAVTAIAQFQESTNNKTQYVLYNESHSKLSLLNNNEDSVKESKVPVEKKSVKNRQTYARVPCKCPKCGKRFKMPYYLNRHLEQTLARVCYDCGVIIDREKLGKHLKKSHKRIVYECNICWKLFDEMSSRDLHLRLAHSNGLDCKYCGVAFTNERAMHAHTYSHTIIHCASCTKSYENRKCYYYHAKKCKSERKQETLFICDYCQKSYYRKPSLRIHMIQKHLRPLSFTCEVCGKQTSTLAHLRAHENVHKIVRKMYKCHCGEVMRSLLGYNQHQMLHTGVRPYECKECGERFLSSSRRTDHIKRKHRSSEHMTHGCTECTARFIRPCELKKHYLTVHSLVVSIPSQPRVRKQKAAPEKVL